MEKRVAYCGCHAPAEKNGAMRGSFAPDGMAQQKRCVFARVENRMQGQKGRQAKKCAAAPSAIWLGIDCRQGRFGIENCSAAVGFCRKMR